MTPILEKIGAGVAEKVITGLIGNNLVEKFTSLNTKLGTYEFYYEFVIKLSEISSLDLTQKTINNKLQKYIVRGNYLEYNNTQFQYKINWDFYEDISDDDDDELYYQDVVFDHNVLREDVGENIVKQYIEGFRLLVYPAYSNVDIKNVFVDGYDLMDNIMRSLDNDYNINIKIPTPYAVFRSNKQTAKKIFDRIQKSKNVNLKQYSRKENIPDNKAVVIAYIRDSLSVKDLYESLYKRKLIPW